jgi:tetratricopeptide (TPR) repeat protein
MSSTEIAQNYLTQAQILLDAKNFNAGINFIKKSLQLNAENAYAYYLLAIAFYNTNQPKAARLEIEHALKLNPDSDPILDMAATIALSQKRFKDAKQYIDRALAIDHQVSEYYHTLAILYSETKKKKLILPTLEDGLRQNPENLDILAEIARYYYNKESLDNFKKAQTYISRVLKIDPQHELANVLQGYLFLFDNKIEEAKSHAFIALNHNADCADAQRLLFYIQVRLSYVWKLWWIVIVINTKYPLWWRKIYIYFLIYIFAVVPALFLMALETKLGVVKTLAVGSISSIYFIVLSCKIPSLLLLIYLLSGRLFFWLRVKRELRNVKLKSSF